MLKVKDYCNKVRGSFPIEMLLNIFVMSIIIAIIVLAICALNRPISSQQYKQITNYTEQAAFPQTQLLAIHLIQQEQIKVLEYLRLLRAYHNESSHVKQYPAMDIADGN